MILATSTRRVPIHVDQRFACDAWLLVEMFWPVIELEELIGMPLRFKAARRTLSNLRWALRFLRASLQAKVVNRISQLLGGGQHDPASEDRQALAKLMKAVRGQVSSKVQAQIQLINDIILGILPHYSQFPLGSAELFVVNRTATDYLPGALQTYLSLPPAYRVNHVVADGKTAEQILLEQLDVLISKMNEVADAVHQKDAEALLASGRFLESKFGRSTLDLSPAPSVPAPSPAPRPSRPPQSSQRAPVTTTAQAAWDDGADSHDDELDRLVFELAQKEKEDKGQDDAAKAREAWGDSEP